MGPQNFDLEALIRACAIGLGVGLIGAYIGHLVDRSRKLILAAIGLAMLVAVAVYYACPSLVTVPSLDNLAQATAEELLIRRGLAPDPKPRQAPGVEAGRVVPQSQSPVSGLAVHRNTVVSFGVSVSGVGPTPPPIVSPTGPPSASLFQPKSGEMLHCEAGGDGIYHCLAKGTSSGLTAGAFHPLLWLRPVNPPSDQFGWYLQRPGNGISRVEGDGSWVGVAQLGNAQFPPQEGNVADLAVSVVDDATFVQLMGRGGVVVEPQPAGVRVDTALKVVVTLK